MDDKKFEEMRASLVQQMGKYPNCTIANCACDERAGEWDRGCLCLGHMKKMDVLFGEHGWNLAEMTEYAKGSPAKRRALLLVRGNNA